MCVALNHKLAPAVCVTKPLLYACVCVIAVSLQCDAFNSFEGSAAAVHKSN